MRNRREKRPLLRRWCLLICIAVLGFCMNMGHAGAWEAGAAEADGSGDSGLKISDVKVVENDRETDAAIKKINADQGLVLFGADRSEGDGESDSDCDKTVYFQYDERLSYEGYHTHEFTVNYNGEYKVAYCVQPEKKLMTEGEKLSSVHDSKLLKKALYYSYGYPGYDKKMKSYMDGIDREECYEGQQGAYILSHIMLSAIYQDEGGDCDAYKGVGEGTVKIVKSMIKNVKLWPEPLESSKVSLSISHPGVEWDTDLKMQRTEDMKVEGEAGNGIRVDIPEGCSLIKTAADGKEESFERSDDEEVNRVDIAAGESFSLATEASVEDHYDSPQMEGKEGAFETYIVLSENEQDIVYGLENKNSTAFSVDWGTFWSDNLKISTSAREEKSGQKAFYADGDATIIDDVHFDGLASGLEYVLRGQLMDKETGQAIEGCQGEMVFTPDNEDGDVEVMFNVKADELAGKNVVAYEKLYYGEKLLTSHEDINDENQTVTVLEKKDEMQPEGGQENGEQNQPGDSEQPAKPDKADESDKPDDSNGGKPVSDSDSGKEHGHRAISGGGTDSPKTGDSLPFWGLMAFMLAAAVTGIGTIVRKV